MSLNCHSFLICVKICLLEPWQMTRGFEALCLWQSEALIEKIHTFESLQQICVSVLIQNIIPVDTGNSKHTVQLHTFLSQVESSTYHYHHCIFSYSSWQINFLHFRKTLSKSEFLSWTMSFPHILMHMNLRAICYLRHCFGTINIKYI